MMTRLLAGLFAVAVAAVATAQAGEIEGHISKIIDGDTFNLAGETIRLCGIDAPEHGDDGFAEAIVALTKITADQVVRSAAGLSVMDGHAQPIVGASSRSVS